MSSRTILRTTQTLARNTLRPHTQTASLSSTSRLRGEGDVGPNKTHMTDKTGGHKDVQSDNAKGAHEERMFIPLRNLYPIPVPPVTACDEDPVDEKDSGESIEGS